MFSMMFSIQDCKQVAECMEEDAEAELHIPAEDTELEQLGWCR